MLARPLTSGIGHTVGLKTLSIINTRSYCSSKSTLSEMATRTTPTTARDSSSINPTTQSSFETFKEVLSPLATKFYLRPGEIELFKSPTSFYTTMKMKILNSKERVFLASLYLGKGEKDLIDCIREALKRNPNLRVYFLLDGLRGTRETPNDDSSASLLSELIREFGPERVQCRLYKTPALRGWKKELIPKRFNEGLGLQHMKIYGFDNELMLSGANLSHDYFTNRQDRCYLFKSGQLTDYYFKLFQLISSISFQIRHRVSGDNKFDNYELVWPSDNLTVNPTTLTHRQKFLNDTSKILTEFLHTNQNSLVPDNVEEFPTIVCPISQLTPLFHRSNNQSTESKTVLSILSAIKTPRINWTFTAGYFNLLPAIKHKLMQTPSMDATIITASQFANSFYKSKGISSNVPKAYLHLSYKFVKSVKRHNKTDHIKLMEWQNGVIHTPNGWSYHAKGIWLYEGKNHAHPFLTIIGSSNYTKRAYSLDLESNVVVLTRDNELQGLIRSELDNLLSHCHLVTLHDFEVDKERHIGRGVKIATYLLSKRL